MICFNKLNVFKDYISQIVLGPFLNTLLHILIQVQVQYCGGLVVVSFELFFLEK